MTIKFGTDGWRAVIAEDFTFDEVRKCAQGTADYLLEQGLASKGLLVGYDTRFASEAFAAAVAEVTAANGVRTTLSEKAAPTPVLSYNVVHRKMGGAVIITASHNPARWNGYKYKPDYGGSASPEVIARLEVLIAEARPTLPARPQAGGLPLDRVDPDPVYLAHIADLVDLDSIRRAGLNIAVDPMHGAGAGYFTRLVGGGATLVTEIRAERNPAFPGMSQPEPLAHNLEALTGLVREGSQSIGLATDGDADRLGVVDEGGRFVTTLQVFALLCLHQLEVLGRRGPLVRSITMTSMVDRLGEIYGVPVFHTPVGFKHLGPVMMRENGLLAGEESGGYAFRGHVPERDGILSGLLMLDMMVKTGKSVSELVAMLSDRVGPYHFHRWDVQLDPERRGDVLARVGSAEPGAIGGRRVEETDTRDGFRFLLEGGDWVLIRFSGTEPLLRIYAEAGSPEAVESLLAGARSLAEGR